MHSVSIGSKNIIRNSVNLLNQPIVKEGIKNIAGIATFGFGLVEIHDVYQMLRGQAEIAEPCSNSPRWIQVINKVIIVCAKISLILSAGVSRPGMLIITTLVGSIFSTDQLNRVFGPNTIFAVNPLHPRHVVSLAAVILALSSLAQSAYKGINWAYKKILNYQGPSPKMQDQRIWLTDTKIRLMALFNTMSSRPLLHIGNQLGQRMIRLA